MIDLNEYMVTFYGNLDNIREDVRSLSDRDPRCVETGDIIMVTFNSALTPSEVSDFLATPGRLFVLQKLDENLILNLTDKINGHLLNRDSDYKLTNEAGEDTVYSEFVEVHPDDIPNIDDETKTEIINKLLERHPNLSEAEKIILKKLTESRDE